MNVRPTFRRGHREGWGEGRKASRMAQAPNSADQQPGLTWIVAGVTSGALQP